LTFRSVEFYIGDERRADADFFSTAASERRVETMPMKKKKKSKKKA
jgi:hypothetical protein